MNTKWVKVDWVLELNWKISVNSQRNVKYIIVKYIRCINVKYIINGLEKFFGKKMKTKVNKNADDPEILKGKKGKTKN